MPDAVAEHLASFLFGLSTLDALFHEAATPQVFYEIISVAAAISS